MIKESSAFCLFQANKKRVVWEITHKCNYACKHCCSSAGMIDTQRELSYFQAISVLKDMRDFGVEEIYFSGGEPFSRADFVDILEMTTYLGIDFNVSTNGSFIDQSLAKRLSVLSIKKLHISLDSHLPEKFNFFRGGDYFSQTVTAIKVIKSSGLYLRVGVVLWHDNIQDIRAIIDFLISLGVDEVVFNWPITVGRLSRNTQLSLSPDLLGRITKEIQAYREEYKDMIVISMHRDSAFRPCPEVCPGGINIFFISPEGQIAPCSWVSKLDKSFLSSDNLIDNSFSQIVNGALFERWKELVIRRNEQYSTGCPAICMERNKSYLSTDPLLLNE